MSESLEFFINTARTRKYRSLFDIGSRDGNDAYLIAQRCEIEEVHVFEPIPDSANQIKSRYPGFNVHELAVSNASGTKQFFAYKLDEDVSQRGISSLRDRNDGVYRSHTKNIQVPVVRFDEFAIERHLKHFDLVKIDTEGCSYETIDGFGVLLNQIKLLHVETETFQYWSGQKLQDDVNKLLSADFILMRQFHCGGQQYDQIWINKSEL